MEKREPEAVDEAKAGPEEEAGGEQAASEGEVVSEQAVAEKEAAQPEELTRLLEDARAKADDHWDQLLRVRADMENLKRRHARELENAHKFALDNFVRELLQVWDSLELGHSAAQDDKADLAKLREGTELTLKLMKDVMGKFGVTQLDPAGEPFNPELHQAMTLQSRDDIPPNHVAAVVQKGYLLNGRLVRPALVMVSQATD
jgi:molecular chaperone GrpE